MLPSSTMLDDVDGIADDVDFSLASAPNVPLCSKTTSLLLFRVPVTLFGVDSVALTTSALVPSRVVKNTPVPFSILGVLSLT